MPRLKAMPIDQPSPSDAMASLVQADAAAAHGQARSRWIVRFQALLGAALGIMTVLLGMVGTSPQRVGIVTACSLALIGVLTIWALRQRVIPRQHARGYTPYFAVTMALYLVAIAVGRPLLSNNAAGWVVAGAVVAAPLGLGAWRASRR